VAAGVKTILCFDPTRGIDIRTKNQIYRLLRDLAASGAAVVLEPCAPRETQLACDRLGVIFGGQVVAEMPAANADEAALLRAAHNLKPGAELPEEAIAGSPEESAAVQAALEQSAGVPPRDP
jgi:ribose transport system ATP-binding protein